MSIHMFVFHTHDVNRNTTHVTNQQYHMQKSTCADDRIIQVTSNVTFKNKVERPVGRLDTTF